ncbi:MAG TPA: hypothetical protein PLD23_04850 [Armatimonadota bacterium]|nr:hypothetical protein [Armatimonadota bacterium]HQK92806.1 hypothetical protein [Armatimonadota bacterium]
MGCVPAQERSLVRELASQVAMLANSDEYETRRRRWRDVNAMRRPDRAPVWCRPAGAWKELVPPSSLQCTDPWLRSIEYALRQHLYKHWVGDDHIVDPWWTVLAVWRCDSEHVWGLRTGELVESTELGGFRYGTPIRTEADFDKVTVPTFTYDHEATQDQANRVADLLDGIMPVRITCEPPITPSLGTILDKLRGMSDFMLDLALNPRLIHRLMAKILEGTLRAMRVAEESGRLTPNHYGPMLCSEPLNGTPEPGQVKLHHLWGVANSQEFEEVSADMFDEFLLNYQIPILQQFGAVQYGCCENLTRKIDRVTRIPNLRVFVASAWTDLDRVIEACSGRYAIMWRQLASDVVFPDDMASIERHLDEGMAKLKGQSYQVVLREIETLAGHPNRLREWARAAIALAEKHA